MNQDDIKNYVVCVNGGSGVVFQPGDSAFTYILTARHLFDAAAQKIYNRNIEIHYYDKVKGKYLPTAVFKLEKGKNYFPHKKPKVDIAILKIPRLKCPDDLLMKEDIIDDNLGYFLAGFPGIRREQQEDINLNSMRIDYDVRIGAEMQNDRREANISKNPTLDELKGTSGGGFFIIRNGHLFLAGIQSEMTSEKERLGKAEFTPAKHFAGIIEAYPAELEPISPCYMKAFSFLKDDAFRLEVDDIDEGYIVRVRNSFKNKAFEVIDSQLTPTGIREFFKKRLLVNEQETDALATRNIWRIWLEFLTILNIVKDQVANEEQLNDLFNTYRLKYSDTQEDWTTLIRDELLYSDYMGLPLGSKIFVGTPRPPRSTFMIPPERLIKINTVFEKNRFRTDKGIHPFSSFTFYHSAYLLEICVLKKLADYAELVSEDDILKVLKEQYGALFT